MSGRIEGGERPGVREHIDRFTQVIVKNNPGISPQEAHARATKTALQHHHGEQLRPPKPSR